MASVKNVRLCSNILSHSDIATIDAVSSEATGYDVENVLTGPVNNKWRSTADTVQHITGSFDKARPVNFFALLGHNIDPDEAATITISFDPTSTSYAKSKALNETSVVGVVDGPFPGVYAWWMHNDETIPQSIKYWKVQIAQPTNPDNYLEVGRLIIGEYIEPSVQMDFGYRLAFRDSSKIQRTTSGIIHTVAKPKKRLSSVLLSNITESEETDLNKLLVGTECFVSAYPESTSYGELEQQHTMLGVLNSEIAMVRTAAQTRACQLSILEGSTIG